MADEVARIKFGVLGGGSVDQGSGAEILRSIQSIVGQIEKRGISKIKFSFDMSDLDSKLKDIQKQVLDIQKASSFLGAPVPTANTGVPQAPKNNNTQQQMNRELKANNAEWKALETAANNDEWRRMNQELKSNNAEWKALEDQMIAVNNVEWGNLKNNLSADKKEIVANNAEWAKLEKQIEQANDAEWNGFGNELNANDAEWHGFEKEIKQENDAIKSGALARSKSANQQVQYNHILDQSRNYYEKYSDSIKKNIGIESEWNSFIGKMAKDPDYEFTQSARKELTDLQRKTREAGLQVETLGQKLKNLFGAHISTAIALVGVHILQETLQKLYINIKEVDKAVVDLQIATGFTREQTQELVETYSKMGMQLGATTVEVAKAADGWLRQGFSIEQANVMIKNSMMLSKLGQIESAEATTALTSAMRGYGVSAEETTGIVDKLVSVDMRAAISAGDIATAMAKTATSARLAGVDMNTLVGYIAAVGETTQASAEEVGVFYKTLFARMGNIKQKNLIDPETGESLSNVETALSAVGIQLRDSNSEFRDFDDVLNDVAGDWDNYGTVQQRAIAVAFAGTRQQEKFLVLMEHFGEAMEYAGVATDSAGTALDKYENSYLKGVEASIDRVKASFEGLSSAILSSDIVSGTFNFGAGIINFLSTILGMGDGIIAKIGLLVGAIALLQKIGLGRILPSIPENKVSTVGFIKLVNCWEIYERYYDYKVA
ncbi:MAG: phage tail tape measure protein [Bacteroides sp.]